MVMFPSMPDNYVRGLGRLGEQYTGGFQEYSFTWTLDYSPVQTQSFRLEGRTYHSRRQVYLPG
jgi:hypothetical protein